MAKAPKQSPAQPAAESASVPSAKTAAEPTAEQILIANLALHFLPKDLPFSTQVPAGNKAIQPDDYINEWRKRNRQTVKELSHRSFEWLYGQDDARDATAFEMLCDDAVARARCLWAAVIGKKRASRVDPSDEEQESNERSYEQKRLNDEINGLWHTHNKEINGEHCLSLSLALRLIIPRSNDKLRGRYFSEWAKHVANEVVHVDWEEQKEVYDTLPYIQYNDDGGNSLVLRWCATSTKVTSSTCTVSFDLSMRATGSRFSEK